MAASDTKIKKLLVYRLSAMGDVAMVVPVVRTLCSTYPTIEVTMLSAPKLKPLFVGIPNLNFIPVDTKKEYKGLYGIWKLWNTLRKNGGYDAMADLHDVLRSKYLRFLMRLSGTKIEVIDKGRDEKMALIKSKNKYLLKAMIRRYAEVFARLGLPLERPRNITLETRYERPLPVIADTGYKYHVGIAPFAQHNGKIYPTNKMEQVVKMLSDRGDTEVFLFGGGEKEVEIMDVWQESYVGVRNTAGKLAGIAAEMDVMSGLDIMLSMDSANMHLASLAGVRVISIWGATHPYMGFYGFGQNPDDSISLNLDCQPCSVYGKAPCRFGTMKCLNEIEPTTVYNKIVVAMSEEYDNRQSKLANK